MDLIASPVVTVILNMLASFLVSKGILDSHSVVPFVQLGNSIVAGIMTIAVAVASIYKMVDLQKHKLSVANSANGSTLSQTVSTPATTGQSGLPAGQGLPPVPAQNPS